MITANEMKAITKENKHSNENIGKSILAYLEPKIIQTAKNGQNWFDCHLTEPEILEKSWGRTYQETADILEDTLEELGYKTHYVPSTRRFVIEW